MCAAAGRFMSIQPNTNQPLLPSRCTGSERGANVLKGQMHRFMACRFIPGTLQANKSWQLWIMNSTFHFHMERNNSFFIEMEYYSIMLCSGFRYWDFFGCLNCPFENWPFVICCSSIAVYHCTKTAESTADNNKAIYKEGKKRKRDTSGSSNNATCSS